jgi:acetyl esterase
MEPTFWKRAQDALVPMPVERAVSEWAVRSLNGGLDRFGLVDRAVPGSVRDIRVDEDLSYGPHPQQTLDLVAPVDGTPKGLVVYIHGGGFRILSKSTHRPFAELLAKAGWAVANIDYRLAPEFPYPAAVDDATRAIGWLDDETSQADFPRDRLVLAGESSGANVALAVGLATSFQTDEPWARDAWHLDLQPWGVVPICGLLQVSDPERLDHGGQMSGFMRDRLFEAARDYLPDTFRHPGSTPLLADPLRLLEQAGPPDRGLPWIFAAVGSADPVATDTLRLRAAVEGLGGDIETHIYDGENHSFHAYLWRDAARRFWHDWLEFMDETDQAHQFSHAG